MSKNVKVVLQIETDTRKINLVSLANPIRYLAFKKKVLFIHEPSILEEHFVIFGIFILATAALEWKQRYRMLNNQLFVTKR